MFCSKCGAQLNENTAACPVCGADLSNSQPMAQPQAEPQTQAAAQPQPEIKQPQPEVQNQASMQPQYQQPQQPTQPQYQQPQYQQPQYQYYTQPMKKTSAGGFFADKTKRLIALAIAAVLVLAVVVVIIAMPSAPERLVTKYSSAMIDKDFDKFVSCHAFSLKKHKDAIKKTAINENEDAEAALAEFDEAIEYCKESFSYDSEDFTGIKIETLDVEEMPLSEALEYADRLDKDYDEYGLDFDPKKVKKGCFVIAKAVVEEYGEKDIDVDVIPLIKYGGKWIIPETPSYLPDLYDCGISDY